MSVLTDLIVREFFELLGYQTCQPCKHLVTGRTKRIDEEADLLIHHPMLPNLRLPENTLWKVSDLKSVNNAVVCVFGWHTERIYPATLENIPEIVRFADPDAMRVACDRLGVEQAATILCLPNLPASAGLKSRLLASLREKGVNGVFCFHTILRELISRVDTTKNYYRSDVLQMIRILKNYNLLQSPQLELFARRPRRRNKPP